MEAEKTSWQIAEEWYSVEEIKAALKKAGTSEFGAIDAIPRDVTTDAFAAWITHQYRISMAKGIDIGRRRLRGTPLKETARFWDIRFDIPHTVKYRQPDGTLSERESVKHIFACVAAETVADAVALVMAEWPKARIWQANNHGRECHILIDKSVIEDV